MWIYPDIDPVALSLGPFAIRWYALSYLAGFLLGWVYARYLAAKDVALKPSKDDIDDFLTWTIIGVMLGGRLGYILFYQPEYYFAHPENILKIWQGGMAFHGGALGVIAAIFAFGWFKKFPALRLADIVCACVPIGLFFGRLANFVNGELFGRVTDAPIGLVFPAGGALARHPSQLYEAGLEGAVLFVILAALIHNKYIRDLPGFVSGAFLAGYGIFRAFIEFFREPDAQIGLIRSVISMGQILSFPMVLIGGAIMIFAALGYTKSGSDVKSA